MFVSNQHYGIHAEPLIWALRGFPHPEEGTWKIDPATGQPFQDFDANGLIVRTGATKGDLQLMLTVPSRSLDLIDRMCDAQHLNLTELWYQRWDEQTGKKRPPVDLLYLIRRRKNRGPHPI